LEFRLAVVLDDAGRVSQTAVLASSAAGRAEGHRILQLVEPEVEAFSQIVRERLERERKLQ